MFPLIGLILGLIIGLLWNVTIPSALAMYVAVTILAALDSIIGALVANFKNQYNAGLFVSGFLANALLAIVLTALGEQLDLQLSLAAVFAFGNRIFLNFSLIRRYALARYTGKKLKVEEDDPPGQVDSTDLKL